jgi:hypothetical protein
MPVVPRPDWPRIWRGTLEDPKLLARLLRKRAYLGNGSYGVVYRVAGAAMKIGYIEEAEAERQAWVHERFKRALPVWAYKKCVDLPKVVTRDACPVHGAGMDEESFSCHCNEPMDIMVMPLAWPAAEAWQDPRVRRTIKNVMAALYVEFDFLWDEAARNLLRWNGRVLMSDFGETDADYW